MSKRIKILILTAVALFSLSAQAQEKSRTQFALSTDIVDWANFGTVNLEAGVSVHQHFSIQAGAKYNPWNFHTRKLGLQMHNKQTTAYTGFRYWPWYVFSGWWVGAQVQYTDYSETGIWRHALNQGQALGGGASFGYTLMLHERFNIEFGAGLWAGRLLKYNLYCCPECMEIRESGPKNFVALNDVSVSFMYVF